MGVHRRFLRIRDAGLQAIARAMRLRSQAESSSERMTTMMIESRIAATSLRGDALHALAQVPAHAAGAEEADHGGGAEDDVPGVDRDAGPGDAHLRQHRDRRRPAAGWRRSRGPPRPGRGRIASIASEKSLPAKPMQKSVSASAPGSMPKPSTHHQQDGPDHLVDRAAGHDEEARGRVEEAPARRHVAGREPGQRDRGASADHGREVRHLQRLDDRVQYSAFSTWSDVRREVAPRAASRPCGRACRAGARAAMFRYSSDQRDEGQRAEQRDVLVEALRIAEAAPGRGVAWRRAPRRRRGHRRRRCGRCGGRPRRRSSDDGLACIVRDDFAEHDEGEHREDHRPRCRRSSTSPSGGTAAGRARRRRPGPGWSSGGC